VLFAASIRDNIRFGRDDASDAEIEDAARAAGLGPLLQQLPNGLDTVIGEDGYGLSGGQAQRIAIARAFIRDAPLVLLDEPTAHLDPATEADVLDSLRRLTVGRTVVLASHSSAAAAFPGRRIVLADAQARQAVGAA
jgi:ATP-binding cassette subfamily C protein CydD